MDVVHNPFPSPAYPSTLADIATCNGSASHSKGPIVASFVLATVGQFTLLILITTLLLFAREERNVSVVSLLVTTLVSTLPPYLLVYGNSIWNPGELGALCVAQAYLLPGCPTMLATALWPMVMDTLVDSRIYRSQVSTTKFYRTLLVVTPYIAFIVFSLMAVLLDQMYPNRVHRRPDYSVCSLDITPLHIASQILSVLALLTALCLEKHRTSAPFVFSKAQPVQIIALVGLQAVVLVMSALSNITMPSSAVRIPAMIIEASVAPVTAAIGLVKVFKRWSDSNVLANQSISRPPPSVPVQLEVIVNITIEKSVDMDIKPPIIGISQEKGCQPL